jgi:penicillin-binding protein 1A
MLPSNMVEARPWEISTSGGMYRPSGADLEMVGPVSLRTALRRSINSVAIALGQQLGTDAVIRSARSFGIEGALPAVASLPLGSGEVTLAEMVRAYSAFANEGKIVQPYLLARVTDRAGQVLVQGRTTTRPALDPQTAFLMTTMLADVVDRGTGSGVRAAGYRGPAAGKTGTTNDSRDAWFLGFTPEVVAGVWVGFDAPRPILRRGYGATIAVPVWASFMKEAFPRPARTGFKVPPGIVRVELCPISGKLAVPECAEAVIEGGARPYPEYFPEWRLPPPCPVHRMDLPESGFGVATAVATPYERH